MSYTRVWPCWDDSRTLLLRYDSVWDVAGTDTALFSEDSIQLQGFEEIIGGKVLPFVWVCLLHSFLTRRQEQLYFTKRLQKTGRKIENNKNKARYGKNLGNNLGNEIKCICKADEDNIENKI